MDYQSTKKAFNENNDIGKKLFGDKWLGSSKNWSELIKINIWIKELYKKVNADEIDNKFTQILDDLNPQNNFYRRLLGVLSFYKGNLKVTTYNVNKL